MFVKYSPKIPHMKVIPLLPEKKAGQGYTFDNDSITLRPGTNELTEQEWSAIQPHIKDQLGKEIVPFSVPVKSGKGGKAKQAKTLKDVPVATARKIIQGCQDPATLKKWFNQELPDELLLVLSKRMRQLKVEPVDLEDDGSEDDLSGEITPEGSAGKTSKADTGATPEDTDIEDDGSENGDDEELSDEDEDEIPDFDGSRSEA
jgi:hypothetical protein